MCAYAIHKCNATEKQQLKTKQSKTKINKNIKTQTNSPEYGSEKLKLLRQKNFKSWGGREAESVYPACTKFLSFVKSTAETRLRVHSCIILVLGE